MRLKSAPADFVVVERLGLSLARSGPWAVYRVQKVGKTTLNVQIRLASELGLGRGQVIFPALKDKNAAAVQHLSLPAGLPAELGGEGYVGKRIGYLDRPLTPTDLVGNRFSLCVREISQSEAEQLQSAMILLQDRGMPNYFDQQRFGSYVEGWGFMGKTILQRDAEGAVYAYLCRPFIGDPRAISRFKERARALWPDWAAMMAEAPRPSNYRSVLTYLIDHPDGYRKALNLIPQRLLSIYLSAYQSYLWNQIAAELVMEMRQGGTNDGPTVEVLDQRLPVYAKMSQRNTTAWADYQLPLPSHTARYDRRAEPMVEALLKEDGFVLNDLKARILKQAYVTKNSRPLLVFPRRVVVGDIVDDERYSGRHKIQVAFDLPRGSYATLVLRVAEALGDHMER